MGRKGDRTAPTNAQIGRCANCNTLEHARQFQQNKLRRKAKSRSLKCIKSRNDPTTFSPLSPKVGGQVNNHRPNVGQYLARQQANFVYKKTESEEMIDTEMLQQESEHEKQLKKIDDTSSKTNPYQKLIVNNTEKIEPLLAQMEQWSILSIMLNYIQYDKHPKNFHSLGLGAINKYKNHSDAKEDRDMIELDFGPTQNILKEEYLDVYKGIQSEIVNTTRYDENSDLSTTYLGKSDRVKNDKLKAEVFSYIRARIHIRKTVRQIRMSVAVRYRCK